VKCGDDADQIFGCKIQPTVANEFRIYSARAIGDNFATYNFTVNYVDEQKINFTITRTLISPENNVRFIINGTQLAMVTIDGVNQTLGANWIYNAGQQFNRIDILDKNIFGVYFPQNNNTQFATLGRSIEGNFVSSFDDKKYEKFVNIIELFNPDTTKASKLLNLLKDDREKIYHIILKVLLDKFDVNADVVKKSIRNYLDHYNTEANIDNFLNKLETFTRSKIPDNLP